MRVYVIYCTNLKYENTFKIDKIFPTEWRANEFIEKLDAIEIPWKFSYEVREVEIDY